MIETAAMGGSKLERFRDAHFPGDQDDSSGEDDASQGQAGVPTRPHTPARRPVLRRRGSRRSRGGFLGRLYFGFKLLLMLVPLTILVLSVVAECRPGPSSTMPDFVRATACARRDLTRHAFSIERTLKTVSERLH